MSIFAVSTPVGKSRSGHGISYVYNQSAVGRQNRDAAIKRNQDNQKAIGNWHNESRGKPNEVPFPKRGAK